MARRPSVSPALPDALVSMAQTRKGERGIVVAVGGEVSAQDSGAQGSGGLEALEIERRLLEIGFVEGARFEILHEGLFGRDPIGVRLDDLTVALRRREAALVQVRLATAAAPAPGAADLALPDEAAA